MKLDEGLKIIFIIIIVYAIDFNRIDSVHNRQVQSFVAQEIEHTSIDQIRSEFNKYDKKTKSKHVFSHTTYTIEVLSVYRRTLKREPKESEIQKRLQRSRQQRVSTIIIILSNNSVLSYYRCGTGGQSL